MTGVCFNRARSCFDKLRTNGNSPGVRVTGARLTRLIGCFAIAAAAVACGEARVEPAPLDTRGALCASCRMPVSDPTLALQLAAPGEEPVFFDDVACAGQLLGREAARAGAVLFVTDHRTRGWVPAATATFTRSPTRDTPMGSRVVAHADRASRDADPAASGGVATAAIELFGPNGPPDGR